MPKESIIKISKPMSKVQPQSDESELPLTTQTQEIEITEELQQPEPEPTDIPEPALIRFATTDYQGWKASDILREIRLDSFEMGSPD